MLFNLEAEPQAAQPTLHNALVLEALAVETPVVTVPLHPVIVRHDVEVMVVEYETETTCVQEGNVEVEHDDAEFVLLG